VGECDGGVGSTLWLWTAWGVSGGSYGTSCMSFWTASIKLCMVGCGGEGPPCWCWRCR
jgi:hypothetical protein